MSEMRFGFCESPIGRLRLVGGPAGVREIRFEDDDRPVDERWTEDHASFAQVAAELGEYFAGERRCFDFALDPRGTPFQRLVWEELRRIPYGETISYRDLARRIGRPTATRAVGAANGRNPLPIAIPCHRVIGASGSLTGYGGGLAIKRRLLALERGRTHAGTDLFSTMRK